MECERRFTELREEIRDVEKKADTNRELIQNIRIDLERQGSRLGLIVAIASIAATAVATGIARAIFP